MVFLLEIDWPILAFAVDTKDVFAHNAEGQELDATHEVVEVHGVDCFSIAGSL
jgi:hypothetical protein